MDMSRVQIHGGATPGLLFGFGLLFAAAALGQTNLETNAGIQFNFSPPGAANLALGGAFLGLANDATTAYTNPAGLTQLFERELHFEGRAFEFTHVFTDFNMDDPTEPFDNEADDRTEGLSFFSYVHPFKHWTIAAYRHELVSFEADFATRGAFVFGTPTRLGSPLGLPGELDGRLASLNNTMDLRVVNHGISLARRFGGVSLGLGLSHYDFSLDSSAQRFFTDPNPEPEGTTPLEGRLANVQTQTGDDDDQGVSVGILWESPKGAWNLGGVFRQGPSFTFEARTVFVAAADLFDDVEQQARFNVPDVYGVGVAFKPNDAVRVTFDYNRVEYSDLTRGFVDIFGLGRLFDEVTLSPEIDRFVIDNADEIHAGFEYFFIRKIPVVVRAGAWYDPDHTLRFEGDNPSFREIFAPRHGSDELHLTLGFGVTYRKIHVAAALDDSERVTTGSLSVTVYF